MKNLSFSHTRAWMLTVTTAFACSQGTLSQSYPVNGVNSPVATPTATSTRVPVFRLATSGQALVSVVHSHTASSRVISLAGTLASYLSAISGATFRVTVGNGQTGIAIGLAEDFPAVGIEDSALRLSTMPAMCEKILLRSHPAGVLVLGASENAVEQAAWELLYRLGYRQFFPGQKWEIVPFIPEMSLAVDLLQAPSYVQRQLSIGYGTWGYNDKPYTNWAKRNRIGGYSLAVGQLYRAIIARNAAAFQSNADQLLCPIRKNDGTILFPSQFDWSNPRTTLPDSVKFRIPTGNDCNARSGLCGLIVNDALNVLSDPANISYSLSSSDGRDWCGCDLAVDKNCISNLALTLSNRVAEEVAKVRPDVYIGMYAYDQTSPPPTIGPVNDNLVISIATVFLHPEYTIDDLLSGWMNKPPFSASNPRNLLGLRDYLSVIAWDWDLPGVAMGSQLDRLRRMLPYYRAQGAQFYLADIGDNWGANGLGYYLASRFLWDVSEANRSAELTADFLKKSFRTAKVPMGLFYWILDGSHGIPPKATEDCPKTNTLRGSLTCLPDATIDWLYRALNEGNRRIASLSDAVRGPIIARLRDLIGYVHYLELMKAFQRATPEEHTTKFRDLVRFAYQIRTSMMVHTKSIWRDIGTRDIYLNGDYNRRFGTNYRVLDRCEKWNSPFPPNSQDPQGCPDNPLKNAPPLSASELDGFVTAWLDTHPSLNSATAFVPRWFSDDLVPAPALALKPVPEGMKNLYSRGQRSYLLWFDPAKHADVTLNVTPGIIRAGSTTVSLEEIATPAGGGMAFVGQVTVVTPAIALASPLNQTPQKVTFVPQRKGLYRLRVSDARDGTVVTWNRGLPVTIESSPNAPAPFETRWTLWFYVPKGTQIVGWYSSGITNQKNGLDMVKSANGKITFQVPVEPGYSSIPVPAGEDGMLWKFEGSIGQRVLLTVPPFLARNASELLLPQEVVRNDHLD